jgi:hypothetical protein
MNNRATLPRQVSAALQAYINIALYEPAVIQLLLVGGVGAVAALTERRASFRERLVNIWQRPLDLALDKNLIVVQNTRHTAEALAGAFDEVVLNLLQQPDPQLEANSVLEDMLQFTLRAVVYTG